MLGTLLVPSFAYAFSVRVLPQEEAHAKCLRFGDANACYEIHTETIYVSDKIQGNLLTFVILHELGHHLFRNSDISIFGDHEGAANTCAFWFLELTNSPVKKWVEDYYRLPSFTVSKEKSDFILKTLF
mgnify:CR=1 FL=1